jgi:hypothetical protein
MKKNFISVNIISLGRDSIYKTLETVCVQELSSDFEVNIILQWSLDMQRLEEIKNWKQINIYNYEQWLWFWYYRNQAIEKSNWNILAWIDDDEWTKDNYRLKNLTSPIIEGDYKVVTAWTDIELRKWYWTDCITYLWYPWGSVIGFDKMWTVYADGTTKHLCSWNFAFEKSVLEKVDWFQESLKSGAEDVAFGIELSENDIKILREPQATIYHVHRSWIVNFCKWHFLRWKSAYEYMQLWLVTWWQKKDKIKSIKHILFDRFFTKYVFGIWILFGLQYLFTIMWIIYAKIWYNSY